MGGDDGGGGGGGGDGERRSIMSGAMVNWGNVMPTRRQTAHDTRKNTSTHSTRVYPSISIHPQRIVRAFKHKRQTSQSRGGES